MLFHPILHVAHLLEEVLRTELRALGIPPRQARILTAIGQSGPVSQAALARAFAVSRPSMAVMVDRLAKDGLIAFETPPGRQRPQLRLSPRGQALLPGIAHAWARVDARLLAALGPEQAQAFSLAARHARDALGGAAPHEILAPEGPAR